MLFLNTIHANIISDFQFDTPQIILYFIQFPQRSGVCNFELLSQSNKKKAAFPVAFCILVCTRRSACAELVEACLNLQPFLVTALGHKVNTPLLDRIADRRFITPTAFGQYLKDIYNSTVEELAQSKAKLVDDITKQLKTVYDKEVQNLTGQVTASQAAYNALLKEKESNTRLLETANQLAQRYQESYRSLQSSTTTRFIIIAILAILAGLVIGFLIK
jgi:hypothetical protein